MRRDILATSLRSLTVQAESICAQLPGATRVAAALATTATPAEELRRQLAEVAAKARADEVERALAEGDRVVAADHADEQVARAHTWRHDLRQELGLLRSARSTLAHDAETLLGMTRERPRRLPALLAWITRLEHELQLRVVVFERTPEGASVAAMLREVPALRAGLEEAATRVEAAREARAAWAACVDATRALLQHRIRLTRAGWGLAQARDPLIPDLDLTTVRGAAGRTTGTRRATRTPPGGSETTC
jgi:hypothetical protein